MAVLHVLKKVKIVPQYYFIIAIVNSFFNTIILVLMNRLLTSEAPMIASIPNWLLFVTAIVSSFFVSKYFQIYLMTTTRKILYEFEIGFLQKLRHISFGDMQKIGNNRILSALEDTRVIGEAPEIFVSVFNAGIVMLCCLGYTLYVSFISGIVIVSAMVLLFLLYMNRSKVIERTLNKIRDMQNDFYRYLNDLLSGFKEIKMSSVRNDTLFNDFLKRNKSNAHAVEINVRSRDIDNELLGNFSWYLVIGLIMYALPAVLALSGETKMALLIAVLYMMRPVSVLVSFFYDYTRIKIAFERLEVFEAVVQQLPENTPAAAPSKELVAKREFQSLIFEDLSYEYFDEKANQQFVFGPVNLKLTSGEIVFITGGNGSGKSTFVNLMTGLYRPLSGAIYYNGVKVNADDYPVYINRISAVFSNYHLFGENYDKFDLSDNNVQFKEYLELVRLSRISRSDSRIDNTAFSKGQQKRMALVYSLLEKRDILVLDEWAAEQDPEFKDYFYNHILTMLKNRGKTVIAVTHDNQYFDRADKVLKFDYGNVVSV